MEEKITALEEEVAILKGEIKAILQEVRTAILASENPFTGDGASGRTRAQSQDTASSEPRLVTVMPPLPFGGAPMPEGGAPTAQPPQYSPPAEPVQPGSPAVWPSHGSEGPSSMPMASQQSTTPPSAEPAHWSSPSPTPAPDAETPGHQAETPRTVTETPVVTPPENRQATAPSRGPDNDRPRPAVLRSLPANVGPEDTLAPEAEVEAEPEPKPNERRLDIQSIAALTVWVEETRQRLDQNQIEVVLGLATYGGIIGEELESCLLRLSVIVGSDETKDRFSVSDGLLALRQLEAVLNEDVLDEFSQARRRRARRKRRALPEVRASKRQ